MKIVENGTLVEQKQDKCKVCGLGEIEYEFAICDYCGWEADELQNERTDYIGGANQMSLNQYKQFWKDYKKLILQHEGNRVLFAITMAKEYYIKHFKQQNEAYLRKTIPNFNEKQKRFEEKRLKNRLESKIMNKEENEIVEEKTAYNEEKLLKKLKLTRNEFKTVGKYGMPVIKNQKIDLDKIDLWCYTKVKQNDEENKDKTIHFFTYDWFFESVYDKPEIAMEKLDQYYALITPEFSLYWDMPGALQIFNTFKNRWCGAYWQKQGKLVIPSICCAGEDSYEFCFDGIEEGSVVAISTYRREKYKTQIMKGYNKMLEVIKPSAVICYGEPFPEMKGNIKAVSPFNKEELIVQMGMENFMKKYLAGDLYPSR